MKGIEYCLTSFGLPVARSANRGRVLASLEIWRPSPIFALRLTYKLECCLRLRLRPPVARSANRGRVLASLEIWRPSPIFALRLTYETEYESRFAHLSK